MEEQKQEAAQTAKEKLDDFTSKYDSLMKELEELGATGNTYDPEVDLPLKGKDLIKMINYVKEVDSMLGHLRAMFMNWKNVLTSYEKAVDNMDVFNSAMSLYLIETHINLIKSGMSITSEEMDKIDAKEKIKIDE